MATVDVAERLRSAAFTLFAEQGYDATTVEHIVERAGVGRSTFFRVFGSKEEVIFPDHDAVLRRITDRFETASADQGLVAVTEAARLVLQHYLDEGERARDRYALTRAVPALRHREIASMQRYQRAFRVYVRSWIGDADDPLTDLRAEVMAAAVVTAHNHVLRHWLRDRSEGAVSVRAAFERAMSEVLQNFTGAGLTAQVTVVVSDGAAVDPDAVAEQVRQALRRP